MMLSHLHRFFLVNAGSIINRMNEFEIYVYALKPDLITIIESWS